MVKLNRKNFLMIALGIWLFLGFILPVQSPSTESISGRLTTEGDACFGNYTCAVIEETKAAGTQLLDVVFAGFDGMGNFLNDHILWVSLGIGTLISGFIFFKK